LSRLIRAVIDSKALRANFARLREAAPGRKVMAVVKANAYGHGLVPTALALPDADAFAVARIEEAVALRAAGVRRPIVLLEGVFDAAQMAEAAQLDLDLVIHEPLQIALLEQSPAAHRCVAWLKVDTGMNRLGFRPEEFPVALDRLRALSARVREVRVLTHLARADERGAAMNADQITRFQALTRGLGLATSIANSAAVLGTPQSHADWIRPGLALYGVAPFPGETAERHGLVPAMTLETIVISTRRVPAGETVGYGGAWRAPQDSRLAIVAAGYGDGLPWALPTGTIVSIAGQPLPLVGRVSMDMIAVDATAAGPGIEVGARVVLWGPELPVERMARSAGTIPYELLCGISQRVPLVLG
jgi:alanine racemase